MLKSVQYDNTPTIVIHPEDNLKDTTDDSTYTIFKFEDEFLQPPEPQINNHRDEEEEKEDLPETTPVTLPVVSPTKNITTATLSTRKGKSSRINIAVSVPLPIPAKLSSVNRPSWADFYDSDDAATKEFIQPHELAAKTYQEYFLQTGYELDVPTSQSTRIKSYI